MVIICDFHNMLNRWKNYLCHLLNVQGINDVRQTEIRTAEPSVPEARCFWDKIAI